MSAHVVVRREGSGWGNVYETTSMGFPKAGYGNPSARHIAYGLLIADLRGSKELDSSFNQRHCAKDGDAA